MTPAATRAGYTGHSATHETAALRLNPQPDSSSLYPPFYKWGGVPPGLRRIPGANLAQEFLVQILRKNSWHKLCARIPGANFAQEFPAQILRKNSQRGGVSPSQEKGGE